MFFLWVAYRNRGRGFYLPNVNSWSSRIQLHSMETGLKENVYIPIHAVNGIWCIDLPEGYHWKENGNGNANGKVNGMEGDRRRIMEENAAYAMSSPRYEFLVRAAKYTREATAFRKLCRPAGGTLTIGRREDCDLRYTMPLVSGVHATLRWLGDGSCQLTDSSSNGSFVNGKLLQKGSNVRLQFGDRLTILPLLQAVYLGDYLAVNSPAFLAISDRLKPFEERLLPPYKGPEDEAISVFREYHRAPRRVQQPNQGSIEVESPLAKEKRRDLPTLLAIGPSMTMVFPMLISTVMMGRSNPGASIAMVATSSVLAVMWGTLNRRYQKKESILSEQDRQAMCTQYYAEMEEMLSTEVNRERSRLLHNYLSVSECAKLPASSNHRLWERLPSHADFLSVRLGLGEVPLPMQIAIQKPKMALINDPLRDEPQRLKDAYSTIHNVPVVLEVGKYQVLGVLGAKETPWLLQSMVMQLTANHSYHDVRIAVIHEEETIAQWAWAKWLPHVYADDSHTLRMVVSKAEAVHEVLSFIDGELSIRAELRAEKAGEGQDAQTDYAAHLPYYVIFCTDSKLLEEQPIMRYLATSGLGFTMVIQAASMELLPKECPMVIEAKDTLGALYAADGQMTGVRFEMSDEAQMQAFSSAIASVRVKDSVDNSAIPTMVTFLEVYNARRVEDVDVWRFWNENHAYQGIRSFIGLKAGGVPFVLDISDKNHGPHGLIAGTTGAGKSVLLQSYILSLAMNYSPTEVQFILIDYKGGGTSEDFRELPHVAGLIDSLQGERAIFRALASIKGEILRREQIFKSVSVNSIDDYMQLFNNDPAAEPLGHLIIIVDEFAELKKEQPEFMHELVSAARVGRSLGMHLILATQKPSNSVSDEIAANTRFRVCLRVASKSDSSEMLHRPEAAYLKGSGRCYVQVGNDEVFEQVQTSFSGAAYHPEALRTDEEPRILNEAGQPIKFKKAKKTAQGDKQVREETELDAVLAYIRRVCAEHGAPPARKLWLDELAETIRLETLPVMRGDCFADGQWRAHSDEELLGYYAMADDVNTQRHVPVAMDFLQEKNQIIVGLSGTGKTTALQTIAVSLALRYTPQQVVMYFFSLTSRSLASLSSLPHVGDIVYEDSLDEQLRLIELIYEESERRRRLFSLVMTDNYIQYNRAAAQSDGVYEPVPAMVVFVDRMQQIRNLADVREEEKLQIFYDLLRSGASQGIFFVMTAFARNELIGKYQPFVHGVALSLNDRADFIDALNARIPLAWGGIASCQGRGAIVQSDANDKDVQVLEMQVALYGTAESDTKRSQMIAALGEEMRRAWTGRLPRHIARIPENPTLAELLSLPECEDMARESKLPFAYSKNRGVALGLNLNECFSMLVCGPRRSGKTNQMRNLATAFAARGAEIHVTGGADMLQWARKHECTAYEVGDKAWEVFVLDLFNRVVKERKDAMQEARKQGAQAFDALVSTFTPIVILIDDLDTCLEKSDAIAQAYAPLRYCCADNVSQFGVFFYASLSHAAFTRCRIKEPVATLSRAKRGILLQGRLNECDPFETVVPYNRKNLSFPLGEGLFVSDMGVEHVVLPKHD